jgi:tRNA nucleotidyltransferase (CCA-adding enzyme)
VRIVIGHANPDFDAYASMVAGTRLYPGAKAVFLGTQNENVRSFHNLHSEFLEFVDARSIEPGDIEAIVMVDTQQPGRIEPFHQLAATCEVPVTIYDHHPPMTGLPDCADKRISIVGATTSLLVRELRDAGVGLSPLEASVMLLGIHEDTGSLRFPNTTPLDAEAAAWLMESGADLEVLNQFLRSTLDDAQRQLLHQFEDGLVVWDVSGQRIAIVTARTDEYVDTAGVLAHYVVEDMGYPVAIAVVRMPGRLQIIGRSRVADVDVRAVMERLGGGGHAQAASAAFRDLELDEALVLLRGVLEEVVVPPPVARQIMTSPVHSVGPAATMRQAADEMARWGHGGVPVVEPGGKLAGIVTRKDVDSAVRHGLDHAPVTGFMTRAVVTATSDTPLSELESLLATRGIGRIPIVEADDVVGIVTRKDVLRAQYGEGYLSRGSSTDHAAERETFERAMESLLPEQVRSALLTLGEVAHERNVRAHVVGGFVRDMLLGRPNLDLDVVVEGDGVRFAEAAADRLGARVKVHRRFGTAVLVLSRDFHVDVTSARTEYYTRPGALPTVEPSTLRQDLVRRDFTINAMAACIESACRGQIADPFGGLGDLRRRTLRVLHSLSFIDDPTRILRLARFSVRYGFSPDEQTESLARRAVELELLAEVSGARVREELYDILAEEDPGRVLGVLDQMGALRPLLPEGVEPGVVLERAVHVGEAIRALEPLFARPVSRRAALIAALAVSGVDGATERWLRHFRIAREVAEPSRALVSHGASAARVLSDRRGVRDSRIVHLLEAMPAGAIAWLWAEGGSLARQRIERYLAVLAPIRPAVTGRDLLAMGVPVGEHYSTLLAQARDDLLDGRAVGREAELANLRRLAIRSAILTEPAKRGSTRPKKGD